MKTLIAYFSWTGNNQKLAKILQSKLKADMEKIEETEEHTGKSAYMIHGFRALFKLMTKIKKPTKNPSDYNLTVIVTPFWVSSFPPAIRTYLENHKDKFNSVALVSVSGRGELNKNVDHEFENLIGKKVKADLLITEEEFKEIGFEKKLIDFVKKVQK
jgi:flavodoxin